MRARRANDAAAVFNPKTDSNPQTGQQAQRKIDH